MSNETMETEANGCEAMEVGSPKSSIGNRGLKERGRYDWTENIKPHIKIVVMGEKGCGKTPLIFAVTNQIFPHPSEKCVSKSHYWEFKVDGKVEECMITEIDDWDENEDRREKVYTGKDIIILFCFNNKLVLEEFKAKWMSKLEDHDVPVIFMKILKMQLLEDGEGRMKGIHIDEEVPNDCRSCCPYQKKGVQEAFEEAVRKVRA